MTTSTKNHLKVARKSQKDNEFLQSFPSYEEEIVSNFRQK